MALRRPPRLSWPPEATAQVEKYSGDFKVHLKKIAETLARQEHSEYVLERHVTAAFESLARLGIQRTVFYKRPEFEIGIGTFFIGAALSFPDLLPIFFPAE